MYSFAVVTANKDFITRAKESLARITGGRAPDYTNVLVDAPKIKDSDIPRNLMMVDIIVADLRWGAVGRYDMSKGGTAEALSAMWANVPQRSAIFELLLDVKFRSEGLPPTRIPLIAAFADNPAPGRFQPLRNRLIANNVHLVYSSREDIDDLAHDAVDVLPGPALREAPAPYAARRRSRFSFYGTGESKPATVGVKSGTLGAA